MSLFSESKVIVDTKQVNSDTVFAKTLYSDSVVTDVISHAFVNRIVEGTIRGPIANEYFKEVLDENGDKISLPNNAIPREVLVIGKTAFAGASLRVGFIDEGNTDGNAVFPALTKSQVNGGAYASAGDTTSKLDLGFNILAVYMDGNPMIETDFVKVKLGYLQLDR